jgi:hypothetical protein
MKKELHNIIEFYKKLDKSIIGYFKSNFDLTKNRNHANKFKLDTDLEPIIKTLLNKTYKKDWDEVHQSMSKHTYEHLYEDWFKDIKKKNVAYRIVNFEEELRRLKLNKLKLNKKGD